MIVSLVLLTASPDLSLLATDVETGTAIARLNDAHGYTPFAL